MPNSLTTNAGAELAPYKELASGFFGSMAAQSAFSKIFNAGDFTRVPLRTLISVLTTAPVAYSVSELAPKPITSMDFSTATLEAEKVSSFVVISESWLEALHGAPFQDWAMSYAVLLVSPWMQNSWHYLQRHLA